MKILIAVDMEGITGVVLWDHVNPNHAEHGRFRRLMTADVNAAVRGAFDGGATEVVVSDGHWFSTNILVEELDTRAVLHTGSPSPLAMVEGIQDGADGVFFIGYHARAGSENAVLDHTWSSATVLNVWFNDILVGESGVNAAVCGHFDTPVLMISGDQTACAQAVELLGPIETAVVKQATGRMSAECLPPKVSQELIYNTAKNAVQRLASGSAPQPYRLTAPVKISIEFINSLMADRASMLPGSQRMSGRRIEFTAPGMVQAYRGMRAAVMLANS